MAIDNEPVGAKLRRWIDENTTGTGRRIGGVRQTRQAPAAEVGRPREPSPYDYGESNVNNLRRVAREKGYGRNTQEGDYPMHPPGVWRRGNVAGEGTLEAAAAREEAPPPPASTQASRAAPVRQSRPMPVRRAAPREEMSADDLNALVLERMGRPVGNNLPPGGMATQQARENIANAMGNPRPEAYKKGGLIKPKKRPTTPIQGFMSSSKLAMKEGGKVPSKKMTAKAWEGSAKDLKEDKKLAKKRGMSFEAWEKSPADKKHDRQQSMKGLKKGGTATYAKGGGVEVKGKTKGKMV